jgi:hypothetical protein
MQHAEKRSYSGGWSQGDLGQSLMCKAVSACRGFAQVSLRIKPSDTTVSLLENHRSIRHICGMQVQCPKCRVIAAVGATKWFFDGGTCLELDGTAAGDAGDYQRCNVLAKAVEEALAAHGLLKRQ